MKARVCFIPQSFNFGREQEEVAQAISQSSALIKRMWRKEGFVQFSKSNDFDEYAANELFKHDSPLDGGAIMSQLYDQDMSKASTLEDVDDSTAIQKANTIVPVVDGAWLCLYSSNPEVGLTSDPLRTICSENSLVEFCSKVLVENTYPHSQYAEVFVQIYQNLIFLSNSGQTFDSIRKIEGGYRDFIEGITDCLKYMNQYSVIPHDSQQNIINLNTGLRFPVTPEGAGKNKRKIAALKRDFLIDGTVYTDVNCEYHYKLERIDRANGNGTYYFNRIYFGFFNRIDRNNPKIAIAHIGEHL